MAFPAKNASLARFLLPTLAILVLLVGGSADASTPPQPVTPAQKRILAAANELLERGDISYTYGGSNLGDSQECQRCNQCLSQKPAAPKQQLTICPECSACSMDCSHFVAEVFRQAGFSAPYLTTQGMRDTDSQGLLSQYNYLDVGRHLRHLKPGDIVVYPGHVVMVEKVYANPSFADIIHATSGRELRGPGQGIQRQRHVDLSHFKGPVSRILRHIGLTRQQKPKFRRVSNATAAPDSAPQIVP